MERKEEKQPETSLQVTTLQTAEVSDPGSTLPIHTHVEACAWAEPVLCSTQLVFKASEHRLLLPVAAGYCLLQVCGL